MVFFRCKTPQETICRALATLAEGVGLRVVACIFGVEKDRVCAWLKKAAKDFEQVFDYLMKNVNVKQVQVEELWTFVQKKEKKLSGWERLHRE